MKPTFSQKMWKMKDKGQILKEKQMQWSRRKKKMLRLKVENDSSSLDSDCSSNEKRKIKQKRIDINNYYRNKSFNERNA